MFCNLETVSNPGSKICIGIKRSSNSWVALPPQLDDGGIQSSVVVNDSILMIRYRAPVASVRINQAGVDMKGYIGDYHGGCPLYDQPNNRVIFVNKGKVRVLDFTGKVPTSTVLTNNLMVRTHSGCDFVKLGGKRSLVVAGGVSYYASKEDTATTSTTVEFIAVEDLLDGEPRYLPPLSLFHARKPAVTQVGTHIFVIGGLRNNQELKRAGGKFIEKWDEQSWAVQQFREEHYYSQFDAHSVFLPKLFCEQ